MKIDKTNTNQEYWEDILAKEGLPEILAKEVIKTGNHPTRIKQTQKCDDNYSDGNGYYGDCAELDR